MEKQKLYVDQLQTGRVVESLFAVQRKEVLPFRNPEKGEYLALTLSDRTGTIEGRQWETIEESVRRIKQGDVARVRGKVDEYRGAKQLIVEDMRPIPPEKVDRKDFLPVSPRDQRVMEHELQEVLASITNTKISLFMESWFKDKEFYGQYLEAPAAKGIHHNYLGGLLEHSLEVVRMVEVLVALYPRAQGDLLRAGALLHDVGKTREFTYYTSIDYSDEGRLMGHVALGYEMLQERARTTQFLTGAQLDHLSHLLLSHHGEKEYGAPILPQTLEAAILHYSDLASGKVCQFQQILDKGRNTEQWTNYEPLLQRFLYRGFQEDVK